MKPASIISAATLLVCAAGFSIRGGYERAMYWYLYQLEQDNLPENQWNIAVGCNKLYNARCTVAQFVLFIWADNPQNPGSLKKPTDVPKLRGEPLADKDPVSIAKSIISFDKGSLAKFNDPGKTYKGATDYYDAVKKMGDAYNAMKDLTSKIKPDDKDSKAQIDKNTKKLAQVKLAAQGLQDLRRMDFEKNLISAVGRFLKTVQTTAGTDLAGLPVTMMQKATAKGVDDWKVLDKQATIAKYISQVDDLENKLNAEITRLMGTPEGISHTQALEASRITLQKMC